MKIKLALLAALLGAAVAAAPLAAPAEETPKYGGILTYVIPADAPPSFDAHRETTFATIHSAAPFYSVLIRVDPNNPSSSTDFICGLCTAMPQPTDGGKTYTFKIRDGVKFHDGSPLTSADVAATGTRSSTRRRACRAHARAIALWSTTSRRPTRRLWCFI